MKSINTTILLLSGIFFLSCQGSSEFEIDVLTAKRDSLKDAKASISTQISDLESSIATLDTSIEKRITVVTAVDLQPTT
ncbi:hypothetical protein N9C06_07740, partial [Salibacteraceae bacterium]|nr:hypothetical protein [Salibacteraceae bacterium]